MLPSSNPAAARRHICVALVSLACSSGGHSRRPADDDRVVALRETLSTLTRTSPSIAGCGLTRPTRSRTSCSRSRAADASCCSATSTTRRSTRRSAARARRRPRRPPPPPNAKRPEAVTTTARPRIVVRSRRWPSRSAPSFARRIGSPRRARNSVATVERILTAHARARAPPPPPPGEDHVVTYLNVVREPVARCVSRYNYEAFQKRRIRPEPIEVIVCVWPSPRDVRAILFL